MGGFFYDRREIKASMLNVIDEFQEVADLGLGSGFERAYGSVYGRLPRTALFTDAFNGIDGCEATCRHFADRFL